MGINDVENFDFMSKPSEETVSASINELELLGALKKKADETINNYLNLTNQSANKKRLLSVKYELTDIGKKMAQFPLGINFNFLFYQINIKFNLLKLDPKLSRCIIAAEKLNCLEEILKIVSVMSVDSIFHNVSNKQEQIANIKQKFVSSDGDHLTLLNVYKAFVSNKNKKEWCNENYLDFKNLKLSVEIYRQIKEVCLRNNILGTTNCHSGTANIRTALIHGFFMNAAEYFKENEYKTITSRQIVQIHPSSVLFSSKPSCIIYNELVKTNKTYLR